MEITVEKIRQAVIDKNIGFLRVRECSVCNSSIGYYFQINELKEREVIWDGGCDCSRLFGAEVRNWQDILDHYITTENYPEERKQLDNLFGFDRSRRLINIEVEFQITNNENFSDEELDKLFADHVKMLKGQMITWLNNVSEDNQFNNNAIIYTIPD